MTDWAALRVEYVHGTATMRELAANHGIKAAGVMRRAAKEGWDADRKQKSAEVIRVSGEKLTEDRAAMLAKFNEDDLKMARAIRAKAARLMGGDGLSPQDLRALAGAVDTAQKVGRLALGAETESTVSTVTTRQINATVDDFV